MTLQRPAALLSLLSLCLSPLLFSTTSVEAIPTSKRANPTIQLDEGTFTGTTTGTIDKFLGIPFAQPPTGDLRFRLPQSVDAYTGTFDATAMAPSCPQQDLTLPISNVLTQEAVDALLNTVYGVIFPDSEDCLYINVVKPSSATNNSALPVAVWIFGGGFELGGPSMYDGASIVQRSIDLGEPVVYVSMAYRVSAFGFLASQEVKDAGVGNLGLQDQREALRWVQKYIGAFGGDPSKVTIWGESAGAISVALHMLTNGGDTEGLFRGAFMESGSPIPVGDITGGQPYYDDLVERTGCSGSSDTLECLRGVEYQTLLDAVNQSPSIFSYQSLSLAWLPRADGVFLEDLPQQLVLQGSVADIPFVSGDCDDEGTLFSLSNLNVTTNAEVTAYISEIYLPTGTSSEITQLLSLYPSDVSDGSPFDTSVLNAITPEFKRLAAMQGDLVFQAPRRFFQGQMSGKSDQWSFLSKRNKAIPVLGSFHASDILNVYGGGDMATYLVNFVNSLDPNTNSAGVATGGLLNWPQYSNSTPTMMTFLDGLIPRALSDDTYRSDAMAFMTELSLRHPI